jgi:hypothetical protein
MGRRTDDVPLPFDDIVFVNVIFSVFQPNTHSHNLPSGIEFILAWTLPKHNALECKKSILFLDKIDAFL